MVNLICKFFLFLVFVSLTFAQSKSNFEIIDSLISSIVDDISSQIKSEKIRVESNLQDKVIENRILNSFLRKFAVFFYDSVADADIVRLDAFKSKINYVPESKGFFKSPVVKRNIEVSLYCSAIGNGELLFSRDFKRIYSDYVKADEIKNFEDKAFNFTQGEFAGGSLTLSKIIEGIVIVSSIGIAVYLLFAVRK
ncbi:MAG: hypothetical protein ACK44H_04795 [Candidatus Kryptonium sp.]